MRRLLPCAVLAITVGCASSLQSGTANWLQLETADLQVRTNLPSRPATQVASDAQHIANAVTEEFPCASQTLREKISVTVLRDATQLKGEYRDRQTLMLDVPPTLLVQGDDPGTLHTLFVHELAHRLLAACVPTAPIWVHEGIATFYETAQLSDGNLRLGFPPFLFTDRVGKTKVTGLTPTTFRGSPVYVLPPTMAPSFAELTSMTPQEFYRDHDPDAATANYAASWTLVHLLMIAPPDLQARFGKYLDMLHRGAHPQHAWDSSFSGVDVGALYAERVSRGAADWYETPAEDASSLPPKAVDLSRHDAALERARLEPWGTEAGREAAAGWVQAATEANPASRMPSLYSAAICNAGGDLECARQRLEEALEAHPDDPDVAAALIMWSSEANPPRIPVEEVSEKLADQATTPFQLTAAALGRLQSGALGDALVLAERALDGAPANWIAQMVIGDCYAQLGELENAQHAYLSALMFSSHASEGVRKQLRIALANIGFLLERGVRAPDAVREGQKAVTP